MSRRNKNWKREWELMLRRERAYLRRRGKDGASVLNSRLEKLVPEKLGDVLNKAFLKAFTLVFEKGTAVIEKTYAKERMETDFKANEFAAQISDDRRRLKAFSKKAEQTKAFNLLVSGVEGVGLGILGIGVPDIPLFVAVLLKSIYEVAISYGFSYESKEEQYFILQLIQTGLEKGKLLEEDNADMNRRIGEKSGEEVTAELIKEQIQKTSERLSEELLYMKFLQSIPIAGMIGGLSDSLYLKQITDYASLKYKRRFLLGHKMDQEEERKEK